MKKVTLCLMLCVVLSLLSAQTVTTWQNVRHSAPDPTNEVHVRFNGVPDVTGNYSFYYYQNNAWLESTLQSPEAMLYEALVPALPSQTVNYRIKSSYDLMGQQIVSMNPAYFTTDTFPPALTSMAYVADDPVGDSVMVYYPNLDITGTWCAYSANKIYAAVSNQSNTFPTSNSFTSYNMYFAGLVNAATAMSDSTIYAMVYTANILSIISPGLYKLGMNVADTTVVFQRLGNIQSQVVGGKLMLSCNISDLTADPTFGTWPPQFNSMGYVAGSLRIDVSLTNLTPAFNFGDYSALGQMVFEHYNYTLGVNSQPVITDIVLDGNALSRTLSMTYTDANGDFPLTAKFIPDSGNEIDLIPTSFDFSQPVTLSAAFTASNWSTGTIRISDNNLDFVTYQVANTAVNDDVVTAGLNLSLAPNPFHPTAGTLSIKLNSAASQPVTGGIYNLKGQCVKHINLSDTANHSSLTWNGVSDNGQSVADGVYFVRLQQGSCSLSRKVIVIN